MKKNEEKRNTNDIPRHKDSILKKYERKNKISM